MNPPKITAEDIRAMKARGEKIAALTAYDFPMTKLLDEAGIPFIHVGDTLGMVVLGYPDTTLVTMADMEHHVRAVARAKPRALLAADLPYGSYDTVEAAVTNARRLVAAGAEAVKAEGGRYIIPQIRSIIAAGIPYCGHLGMLPQHVREEGGYKIKGRTDPEHDVLLADAQALARRPVRSQLCSRLSLRRSPRKSPELISVPTIGIGSGPDCDGQILVITRFDWHLPVVHAAIRETSGKLRGGNQNGGNGVEKFHLTAVCRR